MSVKRMGRISEEIKRLVSTIVRSDLKDPRISPMTSITHAEVTRDLSYANIYVSVLGSEEEKINTINALTKASGFIRKEVSHKLKLRHTPEFLFKIDNSIEKGMYMSKLIEKVKENTSEKNE